MDIGTFCIKRAEPELVGNCSYTLRYGVVMWHRGVGSTSSSPDAESVNVDNAFVYMTLPAAKESKKAQKGLKWRLTDLLTMTQLGLAPFRHASLWRPYDDLMTNRWRWKTSVLTQPQRHRGQQCQPGTHITFSFFIHIVLYNTCHIVQIYIRSMYEHTCTCNCERNSWAFIPFCSLVAGGFWSLPLPFMFSNFLLRLPLPSAGTYLYLRLCPRCTMTEWSTCHSGAFGWIANVAFVSIPSDHRKRHQRK